MKPPPTDAAIMAIERPDAALWRYYLLCAVVIPPLFPILVLPLYFRYHTLRYRFTEEGIAMSWGILFRREILLNYARIQDIHLRSNVVERWLGLARILVQTASGSATAEMTIEGIKEFEAVRDFLYLKMRGVKDPHPLRAASASGTPGTAGHHGSPVTTEELAAVLRETAQELRALREALTREPAPRPEGGRHV
jgi:membrane protein YdbS with pleckstrin-like domain